MDNEKLKNLDWMYAKPELQLDDYMLGRKIDKQLIRHVFGDEGDEDDRAAKSEGASFQQGGLNPTYDQLCKLREDPLIAIKRAEQNKAREVVDNPVLMKKFKTYLMQMVDEDKSGGKKRKKKSKKKREESIERDNTINAIKRSAIKRKREARSNSSGSRSRSPVERKRPQETINSNRHRSRSISSSKYTKNSTTYSSHDRHRSHKRHRSRSVSKPNSPLKKAKKYSVTKEINKESKRHRISRSRSRSNSPGGGAVSPLTSSKHKELNSRNFRDDRNQTVSLGSLNPFRRNESIKSSGRSSGFSKGAYVPPKLSKEELEKKRKQMMKDAEEHEQVRVKQLKRHTVSMEEEEKEFKQMKYTEDPTRFMKSGISSRGTDVGDRIRAKLNNVQRTKAQEDKFLSR